MPQFTAPIVGMKHRPAGVPVMNALGNGQRLLLIPEPTNAFDENAIKVIVATRDIGENARAFITLNVPNYGVEWEEIEDAGEWHIGYVARAYAAGVRLIQPVTTGALSYSPSGTPMVTFEAEHRKEPE